MKKLICAIGLMITCATASAEFVDGAKLMRWTEASERAQQAQPSAEDLNQTAMLIGFLMGAVDAHNKPPLCIPANVSLGQMQAIVVKYLRANPEQWNWPAHGLVLLALGKAFPCSS